MPVLVDGEEIIAGARDIRTYLLKDHDGISLSPQDRAFVALVNNILNSILMFNFFKEKENFDLLKETVYQKEFAAYPMGKYLASSKLSEVFFHII